MKTYKPESNFQATADASLVYNLRTTGRFHKGREQWQNDVAISITAHHLTDEERADIARTIRDAMNAKYVDARPEGLPNAAVDTRRAEARIQQDGLSPSICRNLLAS